jgi:uncharacterized membrane protein
MDKKTVLSTLWVFAILNYLYADVLGLMDTELLKQWLTGTINGMTVTPGFLFGAAVLMETAILLVPISRLTPRAFNRWANVVVALLHTAAVAGSLFVGPKPYYWMFAVIEIATTVAIVVIALRWKKAETTS